jgi:dihydroneopterin aldolase
MDMAKITIVDLEVFYCVGVSDEERAKPQRLLLTIDMGYDFSVAAVTDRISKTIDYSVVAQKLLDFGKNRSWKLIEKLASNIADMVMSEFEPHAITVQVKKFTIPQAHHVSVTWSKKK